MPLTLWGQHVHAVYNQAMEVEGVEVNRQTFLTSKTYEELTVLRFIWFTVSDSIMNRLQVRRC